MSQPSHQRQACAARLLEAEASPDQWRAFVGLDGFVDEIIHVVDKRTGPDDFSRVQTISALGRRITEASGHSTNIEVVAQRTKLGGNGPIMANALAQLGFRVTFAGALGYPNRHPVFDEFAGRAEVHSVAESGHTDALEFDDGKIMFTKTTPLNDVTWENIQERFGRDRFLDCLGSADLVGFVNWTMVPHMNEVWNRLLTELPRPQASTKRRQMFFDLADPEKRTREDILRALELIRRFETHFEVILGLNEKESLEIAEVLDLDASDSTPGGLRQRALRIHEKVGVSHLVVHPVTWALAVTDGDVSSVHGPRIAKPLITTGAGDHFNAGFCLGKLLGFDNTFSLLTGVASSGFYVQNALTPAIPDLARLLQNWPEQQPNTL